MNGEYIGWSMNYNSMWKTTNSGINWIQIQQSFGISEMYFQDEFTGYVTSVNIVKKTTNGGLNWLSYSLPTGNYLFGRSIARLVVVNKDTIYGDNGYRLFPNNTRRGIIWISTNGGVNWGFQQPDTNMHNGQYHGLDFVNKDTGWSVGYNMCIRTNNGGGPVIYPTYIDSNSAVIPSDYVLKQNYPNPFNPSTTIEFSLPKDSYVKMKITDISGRTVFWVIYNMLLYSGLHRFKITDFSRLSLPSGVYFYRLEACEKNNGKTYFTPPRKMLYIK